MGYYGLLFLAVWRNSIGKLGMPNYDVIASKQKNISLYIEIDIIWIVYFVQIMFQLVIGLNFMIAIIESTFKSVNDEQENFIYRNKAELNLESF